MEILADRLAWQAEIQGRLGMNKDIAKPVLDISRMRRESGWKNVHLVRLVTLGQRRGADRKSELHRRKRIINN